MTRWPFTVGLALALGAARLGPVSAQAPAAVACTDATDCRAQAEAAIAQGEYERAHDLAWRTVRQGRRNDPALMYLLARAQALSLRPDDALVMLRRVAELGVVPDASTEEFRDTRDLPGWPAVEALIERVRNGVPDPLPARASLSFSGPVEPIKPVEPGEPVKLVEPVKTVEPAKPVEPVAPALVENAGSFSSPGFAPGGLACDAVSGRYVIGDQPGRKLLILAEGADHSIDLTRAVSAGFLDVTALDIDTRNGTLWVASVEADDRAATLHKLQLISGRALASYSVPVRLAPARPVDMAVTETGSVLLLDAAKGRVLVLSTGAAAIEALTILQLEAPTSLTAGGRDNVAYVAHRNGVARIDLRTRVVFPLSGPGGATLAGIERLRRHGQGLIGAQTTSDGGRRLLWLSLDSSGRVVTGLKVIDVPVPSGAAPIFTAVCGDTLAFLAGETGGTADSRATVWTVRRIRLIP